jgi:hypothetical protein
MPPSARRARQENRRYAVFGANRPQNLAETRQVKGHCALAQRSAFNAVTGYIDGIGASRDAGGSARSARRVGNVRLARKGPAANGRGENRP